MRIDMRNVELGDVGPGLVLIANCCELYSWDDIALNACELVAASRHADRITFWSWKAAFETRNVFLVDASWRESHRWTLPIEALTENSPPGTTWVGDSIDEVKAHECANVLEHPTGLWGCLFDGMDGEIAIIEFSEELGFEEICHLNAAAKASGKIAVTCAELRDVKNNRYAFGSYAELAMRVCLERGVNLDECVAKILVANKPADDECQVRVIV